jgi:hypothetical protein
MMFIIIIVCKFNDRPRAVHFLAANTVMWYLRLTIGRGLVYWCPTEKERPTPPHGDITPYRPVANIAFLFPHYFPLLETISFIDASYGSMLSFGEHQSISGAPPQSSPNPNPTHHDPIVH